MGADVDVEKAPLLGGRQAASPAWEFPPSSVFAFAALAFIYCFFAWARAAPSREIEIAAGLAALSLLKRQVIYAIVLLASPAGPEGTEPQATQPARLPSARGAGVLANSAVDLGLWTAALRGGLATGGVVAAALAPVMLTLVAAVAQEARFPWRSSVLLAFPEVRASSQESFHAQIAELIGYLLSLTLWSSVLCPHFAHEEYPVLLQIICLPAAVGGTVAGMVHSVGRTVVNVHGLDELTRKTVEGCATMFLLTGAACAAAVTTQRGVLRTFEYSAWLQISGVVTFVAAVVELLSSWETLICTVSCSTSLVLFAWTY